MRNSDSVFRRVALGAWKTAGDPTVYGLIEFDCTAIELWMGQKFPELKTTPTLWVGMAIAKAMRSRPEINRYVSIFGLQERKTIDVFFQTAVPGPSHEDPAHGSGLTGVILRSADSKTLLQFAASLQGQVAAARKNDEHHLSLSLRTLGKIPQPFMRLCLNITSFLHYDCGVKMTWAGMPENPFGSVFITNVGSLGADCGWAPLVPFTRVPFLVTVGERRMRPWVLVDGSLGVRPVIRLGFTFDHRVMDGAHAAQLGRELERLLQNPNEFLI